MSPALLEELRRFEEFSTQRFYGQRVEPISAATCKVDLQYIRRVGAKAGLRRLGMRQPQRPMPKVAPGLRGATVACTRALRRPHHRCTRRSPQNDRMVLGWLHNKRGVALDELSLRSLYPDKEEASITATFDFLQFLVTVSTCLSCLWV